MCTPESDTGRNPQPREANGLGRALSETQFSNPSATGIEEQSPTSMFRCGPQIARP